MRQKSETRPQSLKLNEYGAWTFCWNITETENGFEFETVDAPGELTRANIKYAMMLERYTGEEITEFENQIAANNGQTKDLGSFAYIAVKQWVENILENQLDAEVK